MFRSISLSFRPRFGFPCEGNANISFGDADVSIDYYVWKGDVLGEAKKFAEAFMDKSLVYQKEGSSYGNGHGTANFKVKS